MPVRKLPNILFILSDDQGPWALQPETGGELQAPNLCRLARQGLQCHQHYCASPVCSPARATLLTGRMPSQHGVLDWLAAGNTSDRGCEPARGGELLEYLAGECGYTRVLAGAGYRCALSGKWHLGDGHHPQQGFGHWFVHAKGGGPYMNAPMLRNGEVSREPGYVTDVITDEALRWLDAHRGETAPFYLGVHYTAPHAPWERDQHPAELYDAYYRDCPFESVPAGLRPPEWVEGVSIPVTDAEQRRRSLSGYFAAVSAMDRNIGRLLDWLAREHLREETLVIFTSDNGMNMGHHGVYGKGNATWPLNLFEESVKVPFIVSQPGRIGAGRHDHTLQGQYDFMPTLLDYLGLPLPEGVNLPGRSLAPLWRGEAAAGDECVVVYDEYGPARMIRTAEWKLVVRGAAGVDELYQMREDPGECRNLAGDPAYAACERELRACLCDWFDRHSVADVSACRGRVDGFGQFGRCGEPAAFPGDRAAYVRPRR